MPPRSLRKRVWIATLFIRIALSLAARVQIFVRVKKTGMENIPATGRVLVCPNHLSLLDPVVMFGALRRNVAFLATAGLFRAPVFGAVMRWMGHIPVYRGTEKAREAAAFGEQVLEQDGVVVMFPEGKCSKDGRLLPAKSGMAHMAFRTGSPVIPVGLVGTNRTLPLGRLPRLMRRVRIAFGEPVYPPYQSDNARPEDREAFTNEVMARIAALSGQA